MEMERMVSREPRRRKKIKHTSIKIEVIPLEDGIHCLRLYAGFYSFVDFQLGQGFRHGKLFRYFNLPFPTYSPPFIEEQSRCYIDYLSRQWDRCQGHH